MRLEMSTLPSILLCILSSLLLGNISQAQSIELDARNKPLEQILMEVNSQYNLQFSYISNAVLDCKVTKKGTFSSKKKFVQMLCEECKLSYKKKGNVFVLKTVSQKEIRTSNTSVKPTEKNDKISKSQKTPTYIYKGQVIDAQTKEPLPFSTVTLGQYQFFTDENGSFNYTTEDSVLNVGVSYVGYKNLDSTVRNHSNIQLAVSTAGNHLEEIQVKANTEGIENIHLGKEVANIKLNHKLAHLLPGDNNNTIFNLMRLQAGVLASGEPSDDYVIWGANKGETQVLFDGITVFSTNSIRGNIGSFNPLIIKDIEVYKGGYDVDLGDRVGGLVQITSLTGNPNKWIIKGELNNQALSTYVNVPIFGKSTLQIAHRSIFPNLFNLDGRYRENEKYLENSRRFTDANLKFTTEFPSRDQLTLSGFYSNERNEDYFQQEVNGITYGQEQSIKEEQAGASINYNRYWKRLGTTQFQSSYSHLISSYQNDLFIDQDTVDENKPWEDVYTYYRVHDVSFRIHHQFPNWDNHLLKVGLAWTNNNSHLGRYGSDDDNELTRSFDGNMNRLGAYAKYTLFLGNHLKINPSVRMDIPMNIVKPFVQPRLRISIDPFDKFKIHLASGLYKQFIVANPIVDVWDNYIYYWQISNNEEIPILNGHQQILSLSWHNTFFYINTDAYFKYTSGLTRLEMEFLEDQEEEEEEGSLSLMTTYGEGRAYGLDIQTGFRFKQQEIWLAYSLSKTEERFDDPTQKFIYTSAPQDQRHELKLSGIFAIPPSFRFSFDYILGSGFPVSRSNLNINNYENLYSRLDLACSYSYYKPNFRMEFGASVSNVIGTKNISFNNFSTFPDSWVLYYNSTPRTFSLFMNVYFELAKSSK
ncbi:MAG: carboxypeptidase-like regulatory domain-containing protein [Saprospiraceae bacterium]|nr:carboxypeptidase-like regulatory domain-containing protein [Saprospiraceae bacterium]